MKKRNDDSSYVRLKEQGAGLAESVFGSRAGFTTQFETLSREETKARTHRSGRMSDANTVHAATGPNSNRISFTTEPIEAGHRQKSAQKTKHSHDTKYSDKANYHPHLHGNEKETPVYNPVQKIRHPRPS